MKLFFCLTIISKIIHLALFMQLSKSSATPWHGHGHGMTLTGMTGIWAHAHAHATATATGMTGMTETEYDSLGLGIAPGLGTSMSMTVTALVMHTWSTQLVSKTKASQRQDKYQVIDCQWLKMRMKRYLRMRHVRFAAFFYVGLKVGKLSHKYHKSNYYIWYIIRIVLPRHFIFCMLQQRYTIAYYRKTASIFAKIDLKNALTSIDRLQLTKSWMDSRQNTSIL